MICENCGAEFDAHEKTCPYCGHLNPLGAEEAYMDRLEDLQEDLGDLKNHGKRTMGREIRTQGRGLLKTALLLALVLALLVFGFIKMENSFQNSPSDEKAMMEFQKEHFGELEDLYEAGDPDALLNYVIELFESGEKGYEAIYDWKHYKYLQAYWTYRDGVLAAADMLGEKWDKETAVEAMLDAFRIIDAAHQRDQRITTADREKLKDLEQKALAFLKEQDRIGMPENEAMDLYQKAVDEYGYFDWSDCRKLCRQYLEDKR